MKYFFVVLGLFLIATTVYAGETDTTQLTEILDVMESNEIAIENWKLYTRGEQQLVRDSVEYKQEIIQLQNEWADFDWDFPTDIEREDNWRVSATKQHEEFSVEEQITFLAYPKAQKYAIYVIYEVHGLHETNSNWNNFESHFHKRMNHLFSTTPDVFTTVTGKTSLISSETLNQSATKLIKDLQASPVEEIKEETFLSISAYNHNWADHLETNGNKMNVQLALRYGAGLGSETTVTIGTPIITIEY
ncbi:YwmB family TATA-box binding protein [Bacillus alkalicellulosilyticus]|uniref:YwmB family TATA-box binding protein n=1 Tax=Alkalihalobacterium alkalicellulosilyticum TaxID=1912214 RepID=UPI0009981B81|nr:YwmB family TATA-box binding protein [Bacillus alkalicellulosilyticus]